MEQLTRVYSKPYLKVFQPHAKVYGQTRYLFPGLSVTLTLIFFINILQLFFII